MGEVQCPICGRKVDYVVDDGICVKCFEEKQQEEN